MIDAVCQWCVASALLMTALLAVNATRAFGYSGTDLDGLLRGREGPRGPLRGDGHRADAPREP